MAKTQFFNRYNPKPMSKGTDFTGHPETCNQLAAEECEISKLLYQFKAGEINQLPVVREAKYNDVLITPKSFEEAKALIDSVTNDFNTLPKDVQRQFGDVNTYVQDIAKMAKGDVTTLAKYGNFSLVSPSEDGNISVASGNPSSSISRGDSGSTLEVAKSSPVTETAGKES